MKPKQILVLAVIFAFLAAGVFVKSRMKPAELATEEYSSVVPGFDKSKTSKIELYKGNDKKIEMSKQDGKWILTTFQNAPADTLKVDLLLNEISAAKGELRGKDPALFSDFGIADAESVRIEVIGEDGKPSASLRVGMRKSGYRATFVRKPDSPHVYLTQSDFLTLMGLYGDASKEELKNDFWVSLNLVQFGADKITRVEIREFKEGKETFKMGIVKEGGNWNFIRQDLPFKIDPSKINLFLENVANVRAQKAEQSAGQDFGFDQGDWQMKVASGDKEAVIQGGKKDEVAKTIPLQVTGQPVVYVMPFYSLNAVDADDSKFFTDNPLTADIEKTDKLVIKAEKKEISVTPKDKKTDGNLVSFFNDLKSIRIARLLFSPEERKKVKSPSRYFVELHREGELRVLDIGEPLNAETREYAAVLRGGGQPFAISEDHYRKLFENLDKLSSAAAGK